MPEDGEHCRQPASDPGQPSPVGHRREDDCACEVLLFSGQNRKDKVPQGDEGGKDCPSECQMRAA